MLLQQLKEWRQSFCKFEVISLFYLGLELNNVDGFNKMSKS
jgi:hypothetical protein